MGRNSRFYGKIGSSGNVAIPLQNAAKRAAKRKRRCKPEAEDITGVNHRGRRSCVLHAVSRRQYHESHEATGLCIARTVTAPAKEMAADGEGIGTDGRAGSVFGDRYQWLLE